MSNKLTATSAGIQRLRSAARDSAPNLKATRPVSKESIVAAVTFADATTERVEKVLLNVSKAD